MTEGKMADRAGKPRPPPPPPPPLSSRSGSATEDPSFFFNLVMADGNSSFHTVPARSLHTAFEDRLIAWWSKGNRAGSVTGTNSVVCSYGKFQPGRPG